MKKSILEVVHKSVKDLYDIGAVDGVTMRHFDALCNSLPTIKEYTPKQIKKIREREKLSQPIFAHILNVSPSTIKHWEIGDKQPSGAALKLLNIVEQKGVNVAF
jgi:putative transcriptional regulator